MPRAHAHAASTGDLLRTRREGEHARVGFVELFFDLVFVFAVTQISHTHLTHLNPMGAVQATILLLAVWWAWIDTSWITNWLDPEQPLVRLMLFGLMGAGLVLSMALPLAFYQKGLVFAVAFAAFQLGRGLFTLWAVRGDPVLRANFQRICSWAAAGAVLWIVGGLLAGHQRLWVWMAAAALECAGPALGFFVPGLGRSQTNDWTVEGAHLAERVGLFVIICLGESIIVVGTSFSHLPWTPPAIAAFVTAFLGTVAMWWLYFSEKHDAASEAISTADDPGAIARRAFTYAPILTVAGIVVSAVGDDIVLNKPFDALTAPIWITLIGGPVVFLTGTILAGLAIWGRWSVARLGGVVAMLALIPLVPWLRPLPLAMATTVILSALGAWEILAGRGAEKS